jgi:type II secretory pathway pseudopilin PulG
MSRVGGFALVELVVALVVFAVGLLGVTGIFTVAAATLNEARMLQWAAAAAGEVADSLAHAGVSGGGERRDARGTVVWTVGGGGALSLVTLEVHQRGREGERGEPILAASALIPSAAEAPP